MPLFEPLVLFVLLVSDKYFQAFSILGLHPSAGLIRGLIVDSADSKALQMNNTCIFVSQNANQERQGGQLFADRFEVTQVLVSVVSFRCVALISVVVYPSCL
jgi:hypothetical protein